MNRIFAVIICVLLFSACRSNKYDPAKSLDEKETAKIKMQLSEFMSDSLKTDSIKLLYYAEGKDGYSYFFITDTQSGNRRGSAGRFHWNKKTSQISDLEEYLLTGVMQPVKIEEAAPSLFEAVLEKDTLPVKFEHQDIVEWPNEYVYYDKKNHQWSGRTFFQPAQ